MDQIKTAPTGRIIRGHLLDVSEKPFIRALKDIDPLLYIRWNPTKLRGWGAWEIRREPEYNTLVETFDMGDYTISLLGLYEINIVNHILDCAFLNYDQLRRLKEMDTWKYGNTKEAAAKNFLDGIDAREKEAIQAGKERAKEALKYGAKHYSKEIGALKEAVNSGYNPTGIAAEWGKVSPND